LGWSDIGSWNAVWDVLDHDAAGNAVEGPAFLSDTRNSLVRSDDSILTTVIGLDDIIVISTSDAVLVVPRARAEEVKGLVEQLKAQNHGAAVEHRRMYRALGLLSGCGYRRTVSSQTHCGEGEVEAVTAETLPP